MPKTAGGLPRLKLRGLKGNPWGRAPKGWAVPRIHTSHHTIKEGIPNWWYRDFPGQDEASYRVYKALLMLGLRPNQDFIFNASLDGFKIDFLLPQKGVALLIDLPGVVPSPLRAAALAQVGVSGIPLDKQEVEQAGGTLTYDLVKDALRGTL